MEKNSKICFPPLAMSVQLMQLKGEKEEDYCMLELYCISITTTTTTTTAPYQHCPALPCHAMPYIQGCIIFN